MSLIMKLEEFYNKHYKKLLIIPLLMLLFSIIYLYNFNKNHGDLFEKDVSLKGGISATLYLDKEINIDKIRSLLEKELGSSNIFVRSLSGLENAKNGFIVETSNIETDKLKNILEKNLDIELNENNFFVEETSSRIGQGFYKEMIWALFIAFILMGIVIFITYRRFIPSIIVIFSAFFDIISTIAVINLLSIRISSAGIAALVLLIGYSVDTDVLLTTRVLKRREGTVWERISSSFKTGIMMTATTIGAVLVGYIFSKSLVFKEVFIIIMIGLLLDILATYIMNAGLLKIYMTKKYNEN